VSQKYPLEQEKKPKYYV